MDTSTVEIYRLRIVMADVVPPIWRLVEVPADFTLDWLHHVIQWAMGWEHEHGYRFFRDGVAYLEDPQQRESELGHELDALEHTLHRVYGRRGRYLRYVYDMEDAWWHHIWLEDRFAAAPQTAYPRLMDGARACPPEGFGGVDDYRALLHGDLDPRRRARLPGDFNAESFDPSPRTFPNATVYEPADEPAPPQRRTELSQQTVDMLGELVEAAREMLDQTSGASRADLCRAVEDLVNAEDGLPPKSADTLQKARTHGRGIEEFLIDCIGHHQALSQSFSTAPLHAAHLLSFWKIPEAIDAFSKALREAPDEAREFQDTLCRAFVWSGDRGVDALIDLLDELPEERRHRALQRLCLEGVTDDRLFELLGDAIGQAGPSNSMVPLLLGRYDDERAVQLLLEALDEEIDFLIDHDDADDEIREKRADYALFLTEMLAESGGTLDDERWTMLEEIDDFYWPSPDFKKRLRRQ